MDQFQLVSDAILSELQKKLSPTSFLSRKEYFNQFVLLAQERKETSFTRDLFDVFYYDDHSSPERKSIPFSKIDFSCFTKNIVYDYLLWLQENDKSVNTINLRLSALKSFLKYCAEEDIYLTQYYIDVEKIHKFKGTKRACVEYLTENQIKLILSIPDINVKRGRRDTFLMIFLYETGVRVDELLRIQMKDVIREPTVVRLRVLGKGSKIRYIPLVKDLVTHLDGYIREFHPQYSPEDLLFYSVHHGMHTPLVDSSVDAILKKYAKVAHSKDDSFPQNLHCHMFRHSIAMAMYKKGIPLPYIKDFLGHANINTVSIYAYADGETIADARSQVAQSGEISYQDTGWENRENELLAYCGLI